MACFLCLCLCLACAALHIYTDLFGEGKPTPRQIFESIKADIENLIQQKLDAERLDRINKEIEGELACAGLGLSWWGLVGAGCTVVLGLCWGLLPGSTVPLGWAGWIVMGHSGA